jgi:predicted lipoprotein with Yx(FWY)xxD motif
MNYPFAAEETRMAFASIAFALAMVMPPDVPYPYVQIIQEGDQYVMRTLDGSKPLYTYDKDQPGKSTCVAACATAWPPLRAKAGAKPMGKWTIITRPDGSRQWAFGGKPVYTYSHDADSRASGDGQGGVWHLLPTTRAK